MLLSILQKNVNLFYIKYAATLFFIFFANNANATIYYTSSTNATLNGNTVISNNWTTNADGTTGLQNVVIEMGDELRMINDAVVTMVQDTKVFKFNIYGNSTLTATTPKKLTTIWRVVFTQGTCTLNENISFQIGSPSDIAYQGPNDLWFEAIFPFDETQFRGFDASNSTIVFLGCNDGGQSAFINTKFFKNQQIKNFVLDRPLINTVYSTDKPVTILGGGYGLTFTNNLNLIKGLLYAYFDPIASPNYPPVIFTYNATITGVHYTNNTNYSFLTGTFLKQSNSTNEILMPMGDAEQRLYRPISIIPTSATPTTFYARYNYNIEPDVITFTLCNTNRLKAIHNRSDWNVGRVLGTANAKIKMYYNGSTVNDWSNYTAPNTSNIITITHKIGGCWQDEGGSLLNYDATSGSLTSQELSSFSPFSFGYGLVSVLPISDLKFTAIQKANCNQLVWTAKDELNVKEYQLEKSATNINFEKIASIPKNGNYTFADYSILSLQYYRLKIIETNGKVTYSETVFIKTNTKNNTALIPNITQSNTTLLINNKALLNTQAKLVSTAGQVVQTILISSTATNFNTAHLPNAIYFLQLNTGEVLKLIKQ